MWGALLVLAFLAAPHSCEWGLEVYTWTGLALTAGASVLPFFAEAPKRGWHALGLAAATIAVWCAGIGLADLQLLCRLF